MDQAQMDALRDTIVNRLRGLGGVIEIGKAEDEGDVILVETDQFDFALKVEVL